MQFIEVPQFETAAELDAWFGAMRVEVLRADATTIGRLLKAAMVRRNPVLAEAPFAKVYDMARQAAGFGDRVIVNLLARFDDQMGDYLAAKAEAAAI